jgi:hypothetical protein
MPALYHPRPAQRARHGEASRDAERVFDLTAILAARIVAQTQGSESFA